MASSKNTRMLWIFVVLLLCSVGFLAYAINSSRSVETDSKPDERVHRLSSGIHSLDLSAGVQLTIVPDSREELVINAPESIMKRIVVEERDGKLSVTRKNSSLNFFSRNNGSIKAVLYTADIHRIGDIEISSGASVSCREMIVRRGGTMEIDLSSGGNCNLTVESQLLKTDLSSGANAEIAGTFDSVKIDVSSGAMLKISGTGESVKIDISSGASVEGSRFTARSVSVDASSGASGEMHVLETLRTSISSGASFVYSGDPQSIIVEDGRKPLKR